MIWKQEGCENVIRERQIRSGRLLEADFYPVTRDGKQIGRGPQAKKSTAEQEKYNRLQAQKKVVRLVNANFGDEDVILTLTYPPGKAPPDEKQAKRDITNYLRRVKTYRAKAEKKIKEQLKADPKNKKLKQALKRASAPLKYIYALESKTYKTGARKGQKSFHFHLFLSGCGPGDRDDYEELWNGRANADRFRPDKFGPEAAAKYITKGCKEDAEGSASKKKKFVCSRNLEKPVQKTKDDKITKRKVELMAKKHLEDKDYWENRYKGYKFIHCYARWNEFNLNYYVSVVMYKDGEEAPPWNIDNWFTYD